MDYGSFNYGSWIIDHSIMDHFNSMIMDYGSFNHIDYHIGSCWIILDHTGS